MNIFSSGGFDGDTILVSKNTSKKIINILRKIYKKEIKKCKNKIKNPYSFYDVEGGIALYKDYIETIKKLGYNNLEIHYDAFGGNCHITNRKTGQYYIFYGEYFDELLGYSYI